MRLLLGGAGVAVAAAAVALATGAGRRGLRRVEVRGESMLPSLQPGDRLVVVPVPSPRPGMVVALPDPRAPSRTLVKRVAAVEGDAVTVAGDNPGASTDSRSFGAVPMSSLLGRAVYRYAPLARAGRLG